LPDNTFVHKCIFDTLAGLSEGLSHFSGPSRVAVIFKARADEPFSLYDPQNLLRGHEPRLKELYLDRWVERAPRRIFNGKQEFLHVFPEENLQLAGLISYGGSSRAFHYQMWFTEHHPDMCAVGPTERWLEHAAWRVSHDVADEKDLYTGISGNFLKEYATHAVRDHIVDEMNRELGWDTQLRVFPILDAVLGISRTREEGAWPRGDLIFVEPTGTSGIGFLAKFPHLERPGLGNFKHVRKLLQAVEDSRRKLISDGVSIVGIAGDTLPGFFIGADFRVRHGFLNLASGPVCSFSDGRFHSTTHKAKLVQVEEVLLESDVSPEDQSTLFRIVADLVHSAEALKHGCTLVLDLNRRPVAISGQAVEKPLDLRQEGTLELAKSLAKVDGALHIGRDLQLHGFACLLDGRAIAGEDRSRGARFNSALRFTAERDNIVVVVVSADRPVSVIEQGVELNAQCQWKPVSGGTIRPPRLQEWLNE